MKVTSKAFGRLLSIDTAAILLGVSPWTIRRWTGQGRMASVKIGRRRLIPETVVTGLVDRGWKEADCREELRLG